MSNTGTELQELPSARGDEGNATSTGLETEFSGSPTNMVTQEDIPPDGGYGWVCTACVFLINAHTWGVNSVRAE